MRLTFGLSVTSADVQGTNVSAERTSHADRALLPRTPGPRLEGCRAEQAPRGSEVFLGAGFEGELLVVAVVVVELGVAAPVDGRVELAVRRLAEREAAAEDVDEELDAQGVVRGGGEGLSDGADKSKPGAPG